jgi:hypothetical protein
MDFGDALKALRKGFRVTRADWPANRYLQLDAPGTTIELHVVDACIALFTPSQREMMASDWRYHHAERGAVERLRARVPRILPDETHGDGC